MDKRELEVEFVKLRREYDELRDFYVIQKQKNGMSEYFVS